jgi:hypothetical protein
VALNRCGAAPPASGIVTRQGGDTNGGFGERSELEPGAEGGRLNAFYLYASSRRLIESTRAVSLSTSNVTR